MTTPSTTEGGCVCGHLASGHAPVGKYHCNDIACECLAFAPATLPNGHSRAARPILPFADGGETGLQALELDLGVFVEAHLLLREKYDGDKLLGREARAITPPLAVLIEELRARQRNLLAAATATDGHEPEHDENGDPLTPAQLAARKGIV